MRKPRARKCIATLLSLAMTLSLLTLPAAAADAKIDVWDFGAEQLDQSKYNNKLTVDEINGWFPEAAPGTSGQNVSNFASSDGLLAFDGGTKTNHRLRSANTALTRYDEKTLTGEDGTVYRGYIYSNSGSNPDVYLSLQLNAGDVVTLAVSSNGGASTINFEGPSGVEDSQEFTLGQSKLAQVMTFYPKQTGVYKWYSTNEKLVVARITREGAQTAAVSGAVTELAGLSGHSVVFTNRQNGAETAAPVSGGKYSAALNAGYTYDVSLKDANGFVVSGTKELTVAAGESAKSFDVTVSPVELVKVTGKLTGLDAQALDKLKLTFTADKIYIPEFTHTGDSYQLVVEKGVSYTVSAEGINDFALAGGQTVSYVAAATADIAFAPKAVHKVTIIPQGASASALAKAQLTFTNLKEEGYAYQFTGIDAVSLRDGVYSVEVAGVDGLRQKLTSNVTVSGAAVTKTIGFESENAAPAPVAYKANLTVGASGCDYATVNDALSAVRRMERQGGERVTVSIQPGNYEEMLVVDTPNVTLKNASATPSTALTNRGVDIDPNAVRITWYYGHGYSYYSMDSNCKYNAEVLAVNKENGYESFTNPGAGTTGGSYWNSSVVIAADGFEADGIIFENSFNQYISPKSLEDVIVKQSSAKEGAVTRAELPLYDVSVQDYAYKERAGALALAANVKQAFFNNCKFVGRQDTLFGDKGATAAFYNCSVYGSTDYIYGGMTAVFAKCDLVFNTGEHKNDVGYITAPQQAAGRGFLMYNCNVTTTTPGVDSATTKLARPGAFGRPWQANTSEAVFYETVIGVSETGTSLIEPAGWRTGLSSGSPLVGEYNTHELSGEDNSAARVAWSAGVFAGGKLADGSPISVETFLGEWKPFEGKDMTISTTGSAPAAPGGTGFVDVPADMYCAEAVKWAVANDVTKGTSATAFSPNQTCTVKEIITLLWRANGSPASAAPCPFQGVESWYAGALSWASEKGLLGAETTAADQGCTRAMVCAYLWRFAGSPQAKAADFTDVPAGADYAKAVSWAVETGITNGTGAGGFSPDRTCSRGEIITFLYRSLVKSL